MIKSIPCKTSLMLQHPEDKGNITKDSKFHCLECYHTGKKCSANTASQHQWTSHFGARNEREVITVVNWFLIKCHWEWELINILFQSLETAGVLAQGLICGFGPGVPLRVTALFQGENVNISLYIMAWNTLDTVFVKIMIFTEWFREIHMRFLSKSLTFTH